MFLKYWGNVKVPNANTSVEVYSDMNILDFYLCKQRTSLPVLEFVSSGHFSVTQEPHKIV